jgi:hypothetical protein
VPDLHDLVLDLQEALCELQALAEAGRVPDSLSAGARS